MTQNNLEKELEFFKNNQKELVSKYNGKFLVIKDLKIEGVYDTEIDAYNDAQKKFTLGTFLIQECLEGEDVYTQIFCSRVMI